MAEFQLPSRTQPRIALLIDADNAPAEKIDEILTELSTFGVIDIRRVYGNWTKHALIGWQNKLLEHALRPMQQFDYSKHKNATDMAMTVDAMELLYSERPDAFGIVSSDADFTPLVMHLRSKGTVVYGFGAQQTPKPFVNACSRFLYLEALAEAPTVPDAGGTAPETAQAKSYATEADEPGGVKTEIRTEALCVAGGDQGACLVVPTQQLRQDTGLMNLLRSAVHAVQDEGGWARVSHVGQQIRNKASFDARNYGYATLSRLLAAVKEFDFRDEGTSLVSVKSRRIAKGRADN